jgi:hypothetical protein
MEQTLRNQQNSGSKGGAVFSTIKTGLQMILPGRSYCGELPALTESIEKSSEHLRNDVVFLAETIGERNTLFVDNLLLDKTILHADLLTLDMKFALKPIQPTELKFQISKQLFAGIVIPMTSLL